MAENIFSLMLKRIREQSKMSQAEIARLLGVKQATVSRIESGHVWPSDRLAEQIQRLQPIGHQPTNISEKVKIRVAIKSTKARNFSISSWSFSLDEKTGDLLVIEKVFSNKLSFLVGDAVGRGNLSGTMSSSLEFGYQTILSTLNHDLISPDVIENILRKTILKTPKIWLGQPSLAIGLLNYEEGSLELLNSGQPTPVYFPQGKDEPSKSNATEKFRKSEKISMAAGEALLLFTDGFLELYNYLYGDLEIRQRFNKAARLLKGDSEAILKNLINPKGNELEIDTRAFSDDATVLVITRKREF